MHSAETISWWVLAIATCVVLAIGGGMIAHAFRKAEAELPELHPDDAEAAWTLPKAPRPGED